MSVKLVKEQIGNFIARQGAEVLCIRGRWGVGKSYTWGKQLQAAVEAEKLKLPRYSYVSLFGINSLDELKFAIFENVVPVNKKLEPANLETLDAFINANVGSWRKLTRIAQSLPVIKGLVGSDATSLVSFMTIRDQLVCIDDLERRGKNLEVGDVLGLISYLREQRTCKVVLILNDEQLNDDAKRVFEKSLEKTVDVSLIYRPTPAESAAIAIQESDDDSALVAERCVTLGITNIRVIKRIAHLIKAVKPLLADCDAEVFRTAVNSIVLFAWSHDQPEEAPTLNFLRDKTPDKFGFGRKEDVPAKEAAWNAVLDAYGYAWTDDLDIILMDGICDGYFDSEKLQKAAKVVQDKVLAAKADGSFERAWKLYHDSFADNQDEVLKGLYESFMRNAKYISPTNLNGTVSLFKELGRAGQAGEMLDHYMKTRQEDRAFYDLDDSPFGENVTDPDVRAAFTRKLDQTKEERNIPAIMLSIKDGWDEERLNVLASTPVEEYRKIFKSHAGADLRRMLANVFQFDRVSNASEKMREISRRAREALALIGAESPINARRVKRFGVKAK